MAVPQELINEIFLRMPVKSLLRFRCICKPVCAFIGDKSFIKSHFKRSFENKIHRKLIDIGLYQTDTDRLRIHALEFDDDFRQELVLEKSVPSKLYELFYSYCNGLVLLCVLPCKLSVWNPSTRKYRILPAFPVKNTRNRSFALGYDSTTDEHKAVVIISKKKWDRSQVWIFELKSNSWRRIQDFPYVDHDYIQHGGNGDCFLDGAMHFICHDRDVHALFIIVAFDVAKETFSVVHTPTFCTTETIPTRLHVFGESLTMSLSCFLVEEQIEILLMKKDGDAVTWTKLYKARPYRFTDEAFECIASGRVAYSKEGNKVFLSSNGMLCSYDLREKSMREILPKNTHNLDMFACTESLVSVGS